MDQYQDKILDHNYDGIQEFDNPMPGWWKAIFVLTVIWAAVYLIGIELNIIPRYGDDLKAGQDELLAMRQAHEKSQPKIVVDDAMLLAALGDADKLAQGKEVFLTNCASCHGNVAQGGIGPNLTDDFWLYGQKPIEIHKTISKGTTNGMPPWESVLPPEEVVSLVVFVSSTRGTNPAGAKEPQGEKYDPPSKDSSETEKPDEKAPTPAEESKG